jgi:hypothetical protein
MKWKSTCSGAMALALSLLAVTPVAARSGSAIASAGRPGFAAQRPLRFSITDLGALAGGFDAEGYSVNTGGDVAGRSSVVIRGVPTTQAFRYRAGKMTALGIPKGAQASFGYGVNGRDQVAAAAEFDGAEYPYIAGPGAHTSWDRLPIPAGTKGFSAVFSINQADEAVGFVQGMGANLWVRHAGQYRRVRLTSSPFGEADSVDNAGDIVGFISPHSYPNQAALLWPRGAKAVALGTFGGRGARAVDVVSSSATSITVAGSAETRKGAQVPAVWVISRHGKKWIAGEPKPLSLPRRFNAGEATGVSAGGWIVGYVFDVTTYEAVLWRDGGVVSLNSLGASASGWDLSRAQSINLRGQITGWGTQHGKLRPFLLTPR